MIWYVLSGLLFVFAVSILVISYIRDSKYMKSKTKDVLSEELRNEIEEEREINQKSRVEFKKAMEDAKKNL